MLAKFGKKCLVLMTGLCLLAGLAWAQGAGTARLVWPYPAGGIPNALARYLAAELSNGLKDFFATEFGKTIGVPLVYVPYQGATPAINDLIAGHLPMGVFGTTEVVELHKGNKLRILATSGTKRSQFVPDVPTFQEQGFSIQGYGWFGVFAPAKTPDDFVNRAARVLADTIRSPQGKARLEAFRMEPIGSTPEELLRIQRADFEFWTPVVRASGFKPAD
jgi:tripartite-type tricarboxylate transporter receptor subunit TctC